MKKLILSLILIPFIASAGEIKEISDKEIESKFLTVVKDVEVEKMLDGTTEFNECRDKNKFEAKDGQNEKDAKIKAASDCFKQKIGGKNSKALEKLAEDLKLQNYGVIKSKNVNDITEYLSKKMRKSLTGVDPDDKSSMTQKWEQKKIVDQKVFIDLYTNQLMKSALFEVSRFCFENLRVTTKVNDKNFSDHWANAMVYDTNGIPNTALLNDKGEPEFFNMSANVDPTKKDDIYKDLVTGLSGGAALDPKLYGDFFIFCQKALPKLCQDFRDKVALKNSDKSIDVSNIKGVKDISSGANACLTMDKLQGIRTTMKNTEKVAKQFDEMGDDKGSFAIQMIKNPQFYQRGKGSNEDSLDELTNVSSADMLTNARDDDLENLQTQCAQGKGGVACDDFLVESDSLDKAIHNVESEMNLKREIELARVRDLKNGNDTKKLEEYLTDNGLFDLLEKVKNPPAGFDIEKEIGSVYDARKIAEIESLKLKVGRRQISEDAASKLSDADKNKLKSDNIKETKEERARLAQVVMFNNIITSQLELTDQSTGKSVGRNTNAWKKEMQGLEESNSYNKDLFVGVQTEAKQHESNLDDTSVVGGGIIEAILGKGPDP